MPFHSPIPDKKQPSKLQGGIGTLVEAEKLMQIALLLPCSVFIGWLAGAWADSRLHQHWIGLAGMVFGGISGLVYVIRLALAADKDPKNADAPEDETRKGKGDRDQD
jgi:ATP synthase protein I